MYEEGCRGYVMLLTNRRAENFPGIGFPRLRGSANHVQDPRHQTSRDPRGIAVLCNAVNISGICITRGDKKAGTKGRGGGAISPPREGRG